MRSSIEKFKKDFTIQKYIVYIAFVAAFIIFAVLFQGKGFLTPRNLTNVVKQTSMVAVMAYAMCFVIGCGQIDLTVGPNAALSGLVAAIIIRETGSVVLGVIGALAVGFVIGTINGNLLVYTGLPAFLITIGMQIIIKGTAMWIADNSAVPVISKSFNRVFGNGTLFGIPVLIIWSLVFLVVMYILLNKTSFGKRVLAVGGNQMAAQYSGINVNRVKKQAMLMTGLLAAFAGLMYAGRLEAAHYAYGEGVEMNIIAAAVLGGANMNGGAASIVGALFGALLMGMVDNGLVIAGMSVSQQMMVRGTVIIVATALGNVKRRR